MKEKQKQQRVVFLEGKKVILRPLRKDTDLKTVVQWVNNPKVTQYLSMYLPMSFNHEEEWFDNRSKRENDIVLAIETVDGIFIGTTGLHNINSKDRSAMHGILIGEEDCWGKGYGTEVGMILLNYAFNQLNLHKVCSSVIGFNKRSLNYHLKCGYKVIGAWRREIFKQGRYYDLILLDIFKKEWLVRWKEYKTQKRRKK